MGIPARSTPWQEASACASSPQSAPAGSLKKRSFSAGHVKAFSPATPDRQPAQSLIPLAAPAPGLTVAMHGSIRRPTLLRLRACRLHLARHARWRSPRTNCNRLLRAIWLAAIARCAHRLLHAPRLTHPVREPSPYGCTSRPARRNDAAINASVTPVTAAVAANIQTGPNPLSMPR